MTDTPDAGDGTAGDGPTLDGRDREGRKPNHPAVVILGTVAGIAIGLALVASVVNIWPVVDSGTATPVQGAKAVPLTARSTVNLLFGLLTVHVTTSTALLLLVLIVGAAGSLIHAATSFADFVGNQRLYTSWVVWYLLRLIIGMTLALLLYFAVRGGFFSASSQSADVNPYGIAALAGLAGLFSKQATDKLREVFETLFNVRQGDTQRKDDLTPACPTVEKIDPLRVDAGSTNFELAVNGAHFTPTSVVRVNGRDAQRTRFESSAKLVATLADELLTSAGSLQITVFTGPPGGGESSPPAVLAVVTAPPPAAGNDPHAANPP
jgi:hypothetical protein